jgi:hypothetical protein
MIRPLRQTLNLLSSLRLTVVLLALSMMLVFMATMAQTRIGIWEVMSIYIRTFWVWIPTPWIERPLPVFPGGWLLGTLLLLNLIAAHAVRFRLSSKKLPMLLIHTGIALLLISELITGLFARESEMVLDEGASRTFTQAPRTTEMVIVDATDPEQDRVWSIPESRLAMEGKIVHATLPLEIKVHSFFPNSRIFARGPMTPPGAANVTHGIGTRLTVIPEPRIVTTDGRNSVTASVEVGAEGRSLGHWLVSTVIDEPQYFEYDGRSYWMAIRPQRYYKPYRIHLKQFTHDRYPGTEIPRAFSSLVRLTDPERQEDRDILISMNQPLRYRGETFYQASYANNDTTSILQVVRNPGWLLPYLGCTVVSLGLLWQFVLGLTRSQKRKLQPTP